MTDGHDGRLVLHQRRGGAGAAGTRPGLLRRGLFLGRHVRIGPTSSLLLLLLLLLVFLLQLDIGLLRHIIERPEDGAGTAAELRQAERKTTADISRLLGRTSSITAHRLLLHPQLGRSSRRMGMGLGLGLDLRLGLLLGQVEGHVSRFLHGRNGRNYRRYEGGLKMSSGGRSGGGGSGGRRGDVVHTIGVHGRVGPAGELLLLLPPDGRIVRISMVMAVAAAFAGGVPGTLFMLIGHFRFAVYRWYLFTRSGWASEVRTNSNKSRGRVELPSALTGGLATPTKQDTSASNEDERTRTRINPPPQDTASRTRFPRPPHRSCDCLMTSSTLRPVAMASTREPESPRMGGIFSAFSASRPAIQESSESSRLVQLYGMTYRTYL